MYKRLFKFVVTTITILTANLLTNYISEYLTSYRKQFKPLMFTFIAMGVITLIFYPLFTKLEDWINDFSVKVVKSGRSLGGKYVGLILIFLLSLGILTYFYLNLWYKIDLLRSIFNGTIVKLW
jgi:hypothetical protein